MNNQNKIVRIILFSLPCIVVLGFAVIMLIRYVNAPPFAGIIYNADPPAEGDAYFGKDGYYYTSNQGDLFKEKYTYDKKNNIIYFGDYRYFVILEWDHDHIKYEDHRLYSSGKDVSSIVELDVYKG